MLNNIVTSSGVAVQINGWEDIYALQEHRTIFRQPFHGIEEIDGYQCLSVHYINGSTPGITGYLPPSELGIEDATRKDMTRLLNMQNVPVQVMDIIRKNNIVVLSRQKAVSRLKRRFWNNASPGEEVEGIVLTPARPNKPLLLEVEGMEIEVPADELYWEQWMHSVELQQRFPLYKMIRAKITELDPENKKLALSIKALKPDPWVESIPYKYKKNDVHTGTIVAPCQTGMYVRFIDGVLCICNGITSGQPGATLQVRIKKINTKKKRIYGVVNR
jgi:ribosomal protein S1